ncbi:MAG: TetR/AcrR family transcriptional regulator [Lachnospiraceae bacterium]
MVNIRNEKQHNFKKQEILQGFSEMVAELGFENVSMAKLAKNLGIPSSLIFYYFENKKNLVEELVDFTLDNCKKKCYPLIENPHSDPEIFFKEYIDELFGKTGASTQFETKMFFACYNLTLRDQNIWQKFHNYQCHILKLIEENLEYFNSTGVIHVKDCKISAAFIYSLVGGMTDYADFAEHDENMKKLWEYNKQACINHLKAK